MAAVTSAQKQESEAGKRAELWVTKVETLADDADTDCESKQAKHAELGARRAKAR